MESNNETLYGISTTTMATAAGEDGEQLRASGLADGGASTTINETTATSPTAIGDAAKGDAAVNSVENEMPKATHGQDLSRLRETRVQTSNISLSLIKKPAVDLTTDYPCWINAMATMPPAELFEHLRKLEAQVAACKEVIRSRSAKSGFVTGGPANFWWFDKLPTEVRTEIWKLAYLMVYGLIVVKQVPHEEVSVEGVHNALPSTFKTVGRFASPLWTTCRESREVVLKVADCLLPIDGSNQGLPLNGSMDTLLIRESQLRFDADIFLPNLKLLALDLGSFRWVMRNSDADKMTGLVTWIRKCLPSLAILYHIDNYGVWGRRGGETGIRATSQLSQQLENGVYPRFSLSPVEYDVKSFKDLFKSAWRKEGGQINEMPKLEILWINDWSLSQKGLLFPSVFRATGQSFGWKPPKPKDDSTKAKSGRPRVSQ